MEDRDILKLLSGVASAKKLQKFQEWTASDPNNAKALELYQTIYDESDHLASYQQIDVDAEFSLLQQRINTSTSTSLPNQIESTETSISDNDILNYIDGLSTPKEIATMETWLQSTDHQEDLAAIQRIAAGASGLKEYKEVDVDAEWSVFQKIIASKAKITDKVVKLNEKIIATPAVTTKTNTLNTTTTNSQRASVPFGNVTREETRTISWLRPLAAAASLALLCTVGWLLLNRNSDDQLYGSYTTVEEPAVVRLSDGSTINMSDHSHVIFFKDHKRNDIREVTIDGKAEFDVVNLPEKPFVVKTAETGVGVRVIGTKFRLEQDDRFDEVIKNISGTVEVYSLADTTVSIVLIDGQTAGFDGQNFYDITEQPYVGQDYTILYVLDHLMESSDWRVTSAPYSKFDLDQKVNINLDQDYTMILSDLLDRADFEYIEMSCDGCYKITRFGAL